MSGANGSSGPGRHYAYQPSADETKPTKVHHPVIVVGGGLVGLTMAIDLLAQGIAVVVLESMNTVSEGSRSICQSKRSLEIWDRLGVGEIMARRGVTWKTGKVFRKNQPVYSFDLLPEDGHKMPAFVNLQQYIVEEYLIERLQELGGQVRWQNRVDTIKSFEDHVELGIKTPNGHYALSCDWLIACDGARSFVRNALKLPFCGRTFKDKFLITDVRMKADFPTERWFWFDPPFHDGQTALLHRQADNIWRIDLQLGWDADSELEQKPQKVRRRLQAMLGDKVDFDIVWTSVYVFKCRTLQDYVHGRIIFAGDAAHQVSPFGARGGNAGVQDADNLVWKLKLVMEGKAPPSLLHTYTQERLYAARENIRHSTRATDFITPKSRASRIMRDQTLDLARHHDFARALVNSGRLSVPAHLTNSPLNTRDEDAFASAVAPGSPAVDAPLNENGNKNWFLNQLSNDFTAIVYEPGRTNLPEKISAGAAEIQIKVISDVGKLAPKGKHLRQRYDLQKGSVYLFRPDLHIAARWRSFDASKIEQSAARACGRG